MNNLERFSTSAVSVADSLQAKADLEWIAARWNDLNARLVPSSTPNSGGSRPAPTSRPPLNLHISNLLFEIETETRDRSWQLRNGTHNWLPTSEAMPQLLRDVANQHGYWSTQEDTVALRFTTWARDTKHRVTRALENPPNPQYVGPCQHCPQGQGDLYLQPGTRQAKCRNCRNSLDIKTQMAYVQQHLETRLMTLAEIRTALNILDLQVPYSTIRSWPQNNRLIEETNNLYRLADAIHLAKQNRERRQTRHQ